MPSKAPAAATPLTHPPLGTYIDNDSLELVQVLGVGGYGVVYRAVDTLTQKSYAVKCLIQTQFHANSRQRQLHMREILLHQLASNHPNVVTLHRVVEQGAYTYIIMDYASDGDLFTQILNHRRYLGNDSLIRHVFLQMLDAVEYCHSLGIYHRDLKPENVLCFENGLRVAITDFGLATTDKVSDEFRTGSVYHMSPECQGGEFAPTGTYSPMFNDIWSLAIILLNLATGRNPWKSASASDPTFQAFLQDPISFLPTVLPISNEANQILVRMLEVDWRDRSTLSEVRQAIEDIETFYSPDAIFDGSMARCPWEAGMDIDAASDGGDDEAEEEEEAEAEKICLGDGIRMHNSPQSCWSDDSSSDLRFKQPSDASRWAYYDEEKKWVLDDRTPPPTSPLSPDSSTIAGHGHFRARHHSLAYSSSPSPSNSMAPSCPTTPNSVNVEFGDRIQLPKKSPLFINTDCLQTRYYAAGHASDEDSLSSSMMQTACEGEDDSSFFLASPPSAHRGTRLSMISPVEFARNSAYDEDMMDYSFAWEYSSDTKVSSLDSHQDMTQNSSTTIADSPISPDAMRWPPFSVVSEPQSYDHFQYSIVHTPLDGNSWVQPQHYRYAGDAESRPSKAPCGGGFFNTMKIFPQRQSPQSSTSRNTTATADVSSHLRHPSEPFVTSAASQPRSFFASAAAPMTKNAAAVKGTMMSTAVAHQAQEQSCLRRNTLLRSPLHWFSPKIFAAGS